MNELNDHLIQCLGRGLKFVHQVVHLDLYGDAGSIILRPLKQFIQKDSRLLSDCFMFEARG